MQLPWQNGLMALFTEILPQERITDRIPWIESSLYDGKPDVHGLSGAGGIRAHKSLLSCHSVTARLNGKRGTRSSKIYCHAS